MCHIVYVIFVQTAFHTGTSHGHIPVVFLEGRRPGSTGRNDRLNPGEFLKNPSNHALTKFPKIQSSTDRKKTKCGGVIGYDFAGKDRTIESAESDLLDTA